MKKIVIRDNSMIPVLPNVFEYIGTSEDTHLLLLVDGRTLPLQRADNPLSLKCKSSTAERTFTRAVANVNMSIEELKTGLD